MRARIQKISKYAPSIFQGKFEFVAKRRSTALTMEHPYERNVPRVLYATLGILACMYVYFVGASVLNVIAKTEANAETERLVNVVSNLENEYFALSNSVDAADGARIGLSPISNTAYVHRPGSLSANQTVETSGRSNEI